LKKRDKKGRKAAEDLGVTTAHKLNTNLKW
jgi:hypothetical protein